MTETGFPLYWPAGWKRTNLYKRRSPNFSAFTIARVRELLSSQLGLLQASWPVLSTNVELRLDGQPRSGQANPADPGAAVYFTLKGKRHALACDKWIKVEHNIRALSLHIQSIRAQERYGVGSIEHAFLGYLALPEQGSAASWLDTLGLSPGETLTPETIKGRFRDLVRVRHPDQGGDAREFQRLCEARDDALRSLTAEVSQ